MVMSQRDKGIWDWGLLYGMAAWGLVLPLGFYRSLLAVLETTGRQETELFFIGCQRRSAAG